MRVACVSFWMKFSGASEKNPCNSAERSRKGLWAANEDWTHFRRAHGRYALEQVTCATSY